MTIMLAVVLSLSSLILGELRIARNAGDSLQSLYAAETGIERTRYFDKKQVPAGATRGFCNICNSCSGGDCNNCTTTSLATNGCGIATCTNCQVIYDSLFSGNIKYRVDAKVTPSSIPGKYLFFISARGFYKDESRAAVFSEVK
jgi:hypothetical protein